MLIHTKLELIDVHLKSEYQTSQNQNENQPQQNNWNFSVNWP